MACCRVILGDCTPSKSNLCSPDLHHPNRHHPSLPPTALPLMCLVLASPQSQMYWYTVLLYYTCPSLRLSKLQLHLDTLSSLTSSWYHLLKSPRTLTSHRIIGTLKWATLNEPTKHISMQARSWTITVLLLRLGPNLAPRIPQTHPGKIQPLFLLLPTISWRAPPNTQLYSVESSVKILKCQY